MKKDLTLGERMVRQKFNPSGAGNVNFAKQTFADTIDKLDALHLEMLEKAEVIEDEEEKRLTIEEINNSMYYAKSYIQSASMHTVFALTSIETK